VQGGGIYFVAGRCASTGSATALRYPVAVLRYPVAVLRYPVVELRYPVVELRYPVAELRYPVAELVEATCFVVCPFDCFDKLNNRLRDWNGL
jgi:hypothetical protein